MLYCGSILNKEELLNLVTACVRPHAFLFLENKGTKWKRRRLSHPQENGIAVVNEHCGSVHPFLESAQRVLPSQ